MEYTDGTCKFKIRRIGSIPDEVSAVIDTKQDKLTFDSTPTAGSSNPVTSDGIKKLVPTGVVMPFAGDSAPEGFLLCDGQAVNRTTYANLFSVIGTKYGEGDGSTTFNVPNLVDRFVEGGSVSGEAKEAGLPNIIGSVTNIAETFGKTAVTDGAFSNETGHSAECTPSNTDKSEAGKMIFDASKSNSIYGKSDTVQPASVIMMYIIKA